MVVVALVVVEEAGMDKAIVKEDVLCYGGGHCGGGHHGCRII